MYYFKLLSFPDQTFIQTGKVLTDTNVSDKFRGIAEKLRTKYQTLSVWHWLISESIRRFLWSPFPIHRSKCKTTFQESHLSTKCLAWRGLRVSPGLGLAWFGLNQSNIFFLSEPDWVLNIKSGRAGTLIEKFKRPPAATRNFPIHKQITRNKNMGQSDKN